MQNIIINSNETFNLKKEKLYQNDCNNTNTPNHQRAIYLIKSYLDILIERINYYYMNIPPYSNQNLAFNLFKYHSLYYNELNTCHLSSEDLHSYQILLKTIAILNEKVHNLEKKLDNNKKYITEIKNKYKQVNKQDFNNFPLMPELNEDDIKNLHINSLFENNSQLKKSIQNKFSDIKKILKTNNKEKTKLFLKEKEESKKTTNIKQIFIENELKRISDENLCLKLELNLLYKQLKEEGKVYEIKQALKNDEIKTKICFEIKEGMKDEAWIISRNFIKSLKNSEFYINYT